MLHSPRKVPQSEAAACTAKEQREEQRGAKTSAAEMHWSGTAPTVLYPSACPDAEHKRGDIPPCSGWTRRPSTYGDRHTGVCFPRLPRSKPASCFFPVLVKL